jgi:hypothetical protein
MGCCLLGFVFWLVFWFGVEVMLGIPFLVAHSPILDGWPLAAGLLYVLAVRIVHGRLQIRISNMDRALGLLLGLARGIYVVPFLVGLLLGHVRGLGAMVSWFSATYIPPDQQNATSYRFLVGLIDMMPFVSMVAVPSVLADLIAAATRSWRLRPSAERAQLKTAQ